VQLLLELSSEKALPWEVGGSGIIRKRREPWES